ncbi:hypothetical protein GE061_009781 [Apolygus lucorum]|uniref:Chitin-binding type-2 domain-containing protein n=1 Tax=Apolygus lucorum TaxID=248454 RepID=A0A8S9Y177_APOLU|nr:hypothetical protein GE061_009781 [Apolygus lucorum]
MPVGDTTFEWFECLGGAVEAVESCPSGYLFNETHDRCVPAASAWCAKPKLGSSLVVKVTNPCNRRPDGYYPVRSTIHVKCINEKSLALQVFSGMVSTVLHKTISIVLRHMLQTNAWREKATLQMF